MGERKITLKLIGDKIPVGKFLSATQHFHNLLKEVDIAISGEASLAWEITDLSTGSTIIETTPVLINEDADDSSQPVIEATIKGLKEIENNCSQPRFFAENALYSAKQLVECIGDGIARIYVITSLNGQREEVAISKKVSANVEELTGITYKSIGSVEGNIETISVHGGSYCNIYEVSSGRKIRCEFSMEIFESIKNALGKRAILCGEVRSNKKGYAVSIKARAIRVFKDPSELPKVDDIFGIDPDFTDGLDSAEYVRRQWRGETEA